LRSHSQPKPRRNLRSRYANMMEGIRSRSERAGSSSSESFTTRRTRSSSVTSHSSLTNPTTPYQDSDHGRLGTGFSILKLEAPRNQTPRVPSPKILALPPWLQDTITELDASHPLRAVFPTLHNTSDPVGVEHILENPPDCPMAHPDDINRPFCLPSTPRIQPRICQPGSDASSDELRQFSSDYPLYQNDPLLYLRSRSRTPSVGAFSQPGFSTGTNSRPGSSARINSADTTHIFDPKITPLSASSLNHDPPDQVFPAPRCSLEYDGIFRYNSPQATTVLPPPQPFAFERPIPVYFDSPMEDPIDSDPLEPIDHDPFKLDPDEYKNLGFKWTPFDLRTKTGRETTGQPPGSNEVLDFSGSRYGLAHLTCCC